MQCRLCKRQALDGERYCGHCSSSLLLADSTQRIPNNRYLTALAKVTESADPSRSNGTGERKPRGKSPKVAMGRRFFLGVWRG